MRWSRMYKGSVSSFLLNLFFHSQEQYNAINISLFFFWCKLRVCPPLLGINSLAHIPSFYTVYITAWYHRQCRDDSLWDVKINSSLQVFSVCLHRTPCWYHSGILTPPVSCDCPRVYQTKTTPIAQSSPRTSNLIPPLQSTDPTCLQLRSPAAPAFHVLGDFAHHKEGFWVLLASQVSKL